MARVVAAVLLTAISAFTADVEPRRAWWSFQKPQRHAVPADAANPVDGFLLEALREKKLDFSPALTRERLLRRVTLDLTGLPPTPGEVDLFLMDKSPDAYEKLVDRLLASPHYGERWALRWLDVVRYADTNGYELDAERPQAWRYRDYVIRSFNSDKPYGRFIQEQIAGDELFPGNVDALVATGFHRVGPQHVVGGNQDEEMNRQEVLTEMTGAIGSVFLGLTVGCARCHNHKFDPIPQADYYRLQAIFAATDYKDIEIASADEKQERERAVAAYKARLEPINKQIAEIEKPYRERLRAEKMARLDPALRAVLDIPREKRTDEQKLLGKNAEGQIKTSWDEVLAAIPADERARRAELRRQLHRIELEEPEPLPAAHAVVNRDKSPVTHILKVGDHRYKQAAVEPGVLSVIGGEQPPREPIGRRSALARWLTSTENPLTPRVMANRIWQLRMGAGLVRTPNDFGVLGERPTNAKLLDWLATEFVEQGWSVKKLDRLIVTSRAYRQKASDDPAKSKNDPDNKLYWRMNQRRLEAEAIRDNVLAVAGTLTPRIGGRPVHVPIEKEVYDLIFTESEPDNLWPVHPNTAEHHRRSIYLLNKRTVRLPMLSNFDQPDAMTSCPVRPASTHALQALSLMNSDFMQEQSESMAARLERECAADGDCRIRRAFKVALARSPSPQEMSLAREFLARKGRLADFCLAMLNRNEFVYIP